MDALTATKAVVFVIDIKTIPALHFTNQPRQKFKLAQSVGHSVPKHQPTCNRTPEPTNRRIKHHKTAELHSTLSPATISVVPGSLGFTDYTKNADR